MNWRRELEALIEAVPPDQMPDLIGELARVVAKALVARMMAPEPDRRGGTDG